jgi:protein phosphatase
MAGSRTLAIPSPSLVVMVGAAGSGKSAFCRRNFDPSQIVSSDACRAEIAGDSADQTVSAAAFDRARRQAEGRLKAGLLTVFDATSVDPSSRRALLQLASRHHLPAVACVLDLPVEACVAQDRGRPDRRVGRAVIARQARRLAASLPSLRSEGFSEVHRISSPRAAAAATVALTPLACDRAADAGPFDVIGDVHGCAGELIILLQRLGYGRASARRPFVHPEGRRAVFVGDLVDRGPRIVEAVRTVMRMVANGSALAVPGNHEVKLLGCLDGRPAPKSQGLQRSLREIEALPAARRRRFVAAFRAYVESLPPHLVLDGGRLAVAHAGLRSEHIGRDSAEARRFALVGETTGDVDRYGLPVRVKWAAAYRGRAMVVYGHTAVRRPEWVNNTVNIDTGCVYGGALTALRYPERQIVSVSAARAYYQSPRALPRGVGVRALTRAVPPV